MRLFAFSSSILLKFLLKAASSFVEELKDVRKNSLYSFTNLGELNQLIVTITNLADTFRNAGFRSIANIVDKKLRHLELSGRYNLDLRYLPSLLDTLIFHGFGRKIVIYDPPMHLKCVEIRDWMTEFQRVIPNDEGIVLINKTILASF